MAAPRTVSTRPHVLALREELGPMLRLATPVVLTELSWMAMGLVDTMFVGRVSAEAIGAVAIGHTTFFSVAIFGIGMLLGLDFLVARAVGAGETGETHRALIHGLALSAVLGVLGTIAIRNLDPVLDRIGLQPGVLALVKPYLLTLSWGMLPMLLFACLRRYLQARGIVHAILAIGLGANVLNAVVAWSLVFGHLGAPALGALGSGWATTVARWYLLVALLAYMLVVERRAPTGLRHASLRIERARLLAMVRIGLPAALQLSLEVGVFTAATALAGRLDTVSLAAHQIALNIASFSFMVPLGLSAATAVRVGHAVGGGDPAGVRRAGGTGILLGAAFMLSAAALMLAAPRAIVGTFTTDERVIAAGAGLLTIAAGFQLFDGLQVVTTGALRGTGDTRTAMVTNLVGYWLVGLPLGYALCFGLGLGVAGLWLGLCAGIVSVAGVLLTVWVRR